MLRFARRCWPTALIVFALAAPAYQESAPERPRILVTNDDGIAAPGLRALAKELSTFADVVVCAPDGNRSGASHSLTYFTHPKLVREVEVEGAELAVSIDGSPADAAHFGIVHLGRERPFDLLVSGMNRGANVGDVSHGSGTVGAAMEGAWRGVPSIAVSVDGRMRDLAAAAAIARGFARTWLERGTDSQVVYSINIPAQTDGTWKGVVPVPMGGSYLRMDAYREASRDEEGVVYRPAMAFETSFPEGSDTAAYMDGFVTVTPLRFDWTHREALAGLADWNLELP